MSPCQPNERFRGQGKSPERGLICPEVSHARPIGSVGRRPRPEVQRVKLQIGESPTGATKWVDAYWATANHYGWLEEFPIWTPKKHFDAQGRAYCRMSGRSATKARPGGRVHCISESPSKAGFAKGLTHQFRLSTNVTLFDISELARVTKQDWYWLTTPDGERWSRCKWEAVNSAVHVTAS